LRKRNDADLFRERLKGGSFMSRTFHHGERRVRLRGERHNDPDLRKLARALIDLAQAEAEAEAQAEYSNRPAKVVELRPVKRVDPKKKDAA
jgi:hypothetical protein